MLDDYFRQYGLIVILAGGAIMVASSMLMVSRLLSSIRIRPHKPSAIKLSIYECGMETISPRWKQFNPRYYLFALLFLVFDVETIFIYPWAMQFGVLSARFGLAVLVEMFVFIGILVVAWLYAWRKQALEWR